MTHALNLTLPLKKDETTKQAVAKLAANFTKEVQPRIEEALRKSKLVHFARVVVIGDD